MKLSKKERQRMRVAISRVYLEGNERIITDFKRCLDDLDTQDTEIEKLKTQVGHLDSVIEVAATLAQSQADQVAELEADVICLKNSSKPCDRSGCELLRHPQFRFCEKHATLPGRYKGGTC